MEFVENIILNSIYILFPLQFYLMYSAYYKSMEKDTQGIVFDFCILSSFYLIFRFSNCNNLLLTMIINVPLLIAYLNKRNYSIYLFSLILIIENFYTYNVFPLFIILEYIFYYILSLKLNGDKKNQDTKIFATIFVLTNLFTSFIYLLGSKVDYLLFLNNSITFVVLAVTVILFFDKGKKILNTFLTLKDLQKEKQIRTSLFKITHEIKNPIAVCKGYLDMFDVNNNDHAQKYIPIIRSEINRTLLLLQDFLDCNHLKVNKELFDINMLLSDVEDECIPLLKNSKINYICNTDYDDEVYIEGDYERIKQVLVNVIKNSIEAIIPKDDSYIEIDSEIKNKKIYITIEDNGTGISKETLEKIKEPFYTTKKNGTGLGIPLSMEIISAHDGTIDYYSEYGKWTKVRIVLPLYKA